MRYLIVVAIIILAGGLFAWQIQAPETPAEQNTEGTSPFGEGVPVVGAMPIEENSESDVSESETTSDVTSTAPTTPPTTQEDGAAAQPKTVTRAMLAAHNSEKDCWIAYKGVVYDVTNWLPRHPGSAQAIAPYCGTADEFAAAFNKKHGTKQDNRLMKEGVNEGTYTP